MPAVPKRKPKPPRTSEPKEAEKRPRAGRKTAAPAPEPAQSRKPKKKSAKS